MHIEPGIVEGTKTLLSTGTAALSVGLIAKASWQSIRQGDATSLAMRSVLTTFLVFCFFEVLPHQAVGVSEVHLILGSTLFLLFGAAPAAIGLALGLLVQGIFFAPFDLPQYGMNLTTLLLPLFAMAAIARRVIPKSTAYVDISYSQAIRLSLVYQGGIVSWVGFWALYGQGFGAENLASVATFSIAYLSVILIEPVLDLAVLFGAKSLSRFSRNHNQNPLVEKRLFNRG